MSSATTYPTLTAAVQISSLTINSGTATITLNGNNLTVSSMTVAGSLTFNGTEQVSTGTVPNLIAGSTVTYAGTSGTIPVFSTWTYSNLIMSGAGATFNAAGAWT